MSSFLTNSFSAGSLESVREILADKYYALKNFALGYAPMDYRDLFLFLTVFFIVLTPSFPTPGPLPNLRLEEGFAAALVGGCLIWLLAGGKVRLYISSFQPLLLFFSAVIVLSMLVGALQGLDPAVRDFTEHIKVFKYLLIFTVVATLADTPARRRRLVDFTIVTIVASALVGFTQYINPLNINERYVQFIAPTQYHRLVGDYPFPRIIGITSNPNEYAVIAAIGVLLCLAMFLAYRHTAYAAGGGLCFLALLMTMSRSGMVFLGVALAVYLALSFVHVSTVNQRQLKFFLLMLLLGLLLLFALVAYAPDALMWRLQEGLDLDASTSWQARLERWEESLILIRESPLLGWGPASNIDFEWQPDNEWLLLTRRYGLLGTGYLVMAFLLPVLFTGPSARHGDAYTYRNIYLAVLAGSACYMIAAVIYHALQIMALVVVIAGIYFGSLTERRQVLHLGLPRLTELLPRRTRQRS